MYPTITLETYPPMFIDDMENEFYDEELLEFTVPYTWLVREFNADNFGCDTLEEFLTDVYTWDDTQFILERAHADNVVIKEKIVNR